MVQIPIVISIATDNSLGSASLQLWHFQLELQRVRYSFDHYSQASYTLKADSFFIEEDFSRLCHHLQTIMLVTSLQAYSIRIDRNHLPLANRTKVDMFVISKPGLYVAEAIASKEISSMEVKIPRSHLH